MILRVLHSFLLYLIALLGFLVGFAMILGLMPFSKDRIKLFQTAAHLWVRFAALFSGVKVITSGLENIPRNKAAIFVANHQSAMDIPILIAYLPTHFRFVAKKELFKIPIFGWGVRQAGHISIDRESILSSYKTLEKIVQMLKAGASVIFFPEGTRSWDGSLGKFKRGSLMAALKSGAPIIPIAISGSYNIMPRDTKLIRPGRVKLSIGKPIYIKDEEEYNRKLEEVREAISKML